MSSNIVLNINLLSSSRTVYFPNIYAVKTKSFTHVLRSMSSCHVTYLVVNCVTVNSVQHVDGIPVGK